MAKKSSFALQLEDQEGPFEGEVRWFLEDYNIKQRQVPQRKIHKNFEDFTSQKILAEVEVGSVLYYAELRGEDF